MKLNRLGLVLVLFVSAGLAVAGCDVENGLPTGASSFNSTAANDQLSAPIGPFATEETDCPNLEFFRLRTDPPDGSVEDNVVKAWIKLAGAPANATGIRVWWNYGDGSSGEDFSVDDLLLTRNADGTISVEFVAEHTYRNLTGETARTIRAELLVGNEGTHCARVRHITVAPPAPDPAKKKKKPGPCVTSGFGPLSSLCPV